MKKIGLIVCLLLITSATVSVNAGLLSSGESMKLNPSELNNQINLPKRSSSIKTWSNLPSINNLREDIGRPFLKKGLTYIALSGIFILVWLILRLKI